MKKILSAITLIILATCLCSCVYVNTSNPNSLPAKPALVSACFLDSLQSTQEYYEFISTDSEYMSKVIFTTDTAVTDFRFFELDADTFANDGTYKMGETLYTLDTLSPEKPLVIGLEFLGIFPHHAVCYTDTDGNVKYYYLLTSGKDGSLIFEEFTLGEKAW